MFDLNFLLDEGSSVDKRLRLFFSASLADVVVVFVDFLLATGIADAVLAVSSTISGGDLASSPMSASLAGVVVVFVDFFLDDFEDFLLATEISDAVLAVSSPISDGDLASSPTSEVASSVSPAFLILLPPSNCSASKYLTDCIIFLNKKYKD